MFGLLVGLLVGFTGVGGGSLMAPIMIIFLGVAPVTAVGTDLWFAAITKLVGGSIHHARGNGDLRVVRWLCLGSIPLAIITLFALSLAHHGQIKQGFVTQALGAVIILTALATLCRTPLHRYGERLRRTRRAGFKKLQVPLTVGAGALLGVLVTLTSVGAGALGATILIFLYPLRLSMRKVVGTDILHAIPLTFLAGTGHLWLGNVDGNLLVSLLSGSIPGIVVGSNLVHKVNERVVQISLAGVLLAVGSKLLLT